MATASKQQLHLRVSPETHAFLKAMAERRGEGMSETFEHIMERLMKADETFFVRHAAGQSFVALHMVTQLARRTFEIDFEEAGESQAAAAAKATAKVEAMLRDGMRAGWQIFGPAPKAPFSELETDSASADRMSAALAEAFRLRR